MTLVATALNLEEKMKIYPQVLTFFRKPQILLFYFAVLQTTAKKWTKVKNARVRCAKLLFLRTKKIVTFSLPLHILISIRGADIAVPINTVRLKLVFYIKGNIYHCVHVILVCRS